MKTLRKIVVTFIVISMLLASFNFAYAGENKNPSYDIITVPCAGTIINKTTVKLLVNDKKSDSLYISAIDAAKFSGYEVSVSGKKVTFTRSTDTYSTSDFITYCNQNWLPLESTLEKLQTQITLNDNALLFTGKKATVAELYSYIGEYVFGKGAGFNYAGFDVENRVDLDNIGFELFMGKVYDVFVDWKAFDILLGKQDFDVYEKVFHDLLKHEETSKFESFISGAYKEVKSFNKDFIKNGKQTGEDIATLIALTELNTESIASFSDLSKLSDLAAKYDTFEDYIHSSEFLNVIKDYDYEDIEQIWSSDYYEALKKVNYGFGLSDVGKAFSDTFSLVNDPIGQITKDAGFKVKGFDVITMLGLVNNIYDIYHASTTSLNEILATYYDENGKLTGCTPYETAFLIKLKDYTDQQKGGWGTVGVAAQEAITNALINASVSEIENMVMEDLLGFTATALGKITSKVCTSAMSFILDDDIAAGYGAINKIVPIATIQNTAESQYYTRKIHDDPVGAKYAALLYLDLYLLECKNETSGNFGSEMKTAKAAKGYYDNLALVNDMDLVTVAKNGFTVKKDALKVLQLEKGVTNLEITALPDKNEYIKDDFIWTEGLELLATYKDGTTENVTRGYTYDPNISASNKEQKVTVTFRDATVDYVINAKDSDNANNSTNKTSVMPVITGSNIMDYNAGNTIKTEQTLSEIIESLGWGSVEVTKKEFDEFTYYRYYENPTTSKYADYYRYNDIIVFINNNGEIAYLGFSGCGSIYDILYLADMKNDIFDTTGYISNLTTQLDTLKSEELKMRPGYGMYYSQMFTLDKAGKVKFYISDYSSFSAFDSRTGYTFTPDYRFSIFAEGFVGWLTDSKNIKKHGYSLSDFNDDNHVTDFEP